eukprot:gnl/MRDRNA2_/MRDRNA2_104313_c0_seq1.p1 gnl/MRDRNA2_/MRDRNA2_104313_c0~~gnl/MRDRNA2_/MRDRNA2_104313_c0_seq1.p1  ORF type:complete len:194 (+),score=34.04 gnl/MRDRNA2_/MRDRNA2_104313_c0_seq1:75-656(+)
MSTWSGCEFEGPFKNDWYEGEGKFKFPNGVVYEGQFRKGEFHGEGALVYPNGGRYKAKWERGYAIEGRYVFNDGLLYEDRNWQYVSQGDRRFYTEVLHGLQPAGKTLLTNEPVPPSIPQGTYDTGHGYFDPQTEQIMSYDGKEVIGIPAEIEEHWIKNHCRKGFAQESSATEEAKPAASPTADAAPADAAPAS